MPADPDTPMQIPAVNTVGARLLSRQNNFDFIRLVAAFMVIVSHSWPLRDGWSVYEPYRRLSGYCTFGEISVGIFFIISGLLVARSYLSDPNPIAYLRKRSLRIFPGLVVCVVFCIFVVGPLFTELGFRHYLFNMETFRFARNAVLYPNHYHLPGVFEDFDPGDRRYVVNGSLWSLPLEFLMYLGVLALGITHLLSRKWVVAVITILLAAQWIGAIQFFEHGGQTAQRLARYQVWLETLPMLGFLFFSGTVILLFRDSIRLDWRVFVVCVIVVALTWQTTQDGIASRLPIFKGRAWHNWYGYLPMCLCLPYIVIYVAFVRLPVLQSATKWGDFSYGVYLYGFPVQQMIMRKWEEAIPFPIFVGLSCLGSLVLAVLSWHLVEKPFMKRKRLSTRSEGSFVVLEKVQTRNLSSVVA